MQLREKIKEITGMRIVARSLASYGTEVVDIVVCEGTGWRRYL